MGVGVGVGVGVCVCVCVCVCFSFPRIVEVPRREQALLFSWFSFFFFFGKSKGWRVRADTDFGLESN